MKLDRKVVKELIKKADMIRYDYDIGHETKKGFWWACSFLNDDDGKYELDKICQDNPDYDGAVYDLKHGVYLYRMIRDKFELIAIISDKGIKLCSKSKKQ